MEKLRKRIHDNSNGLDYVLVGDYYIPDLKLAEENRPTGQWGRMHKALVDTSRALAISTSASRLGRLIADSITLISDKKVAF